MQISLRSQLAVGTAALMGAAAVAAIPLVQEHPLPSLEPVSVEVAMAAFDDPWIQVAGTLNLLNKYLFDPSGPVAVSPGAGTELSAWGIFPQIANDPLPILSAVGTNVIRYVVETVKGVIAVCNQLAAGHMQAAGITALRTLTYAPAAMLSHAYYLLRAIPDIVGIFTNPLVPQLQAIADVIAKTALGVAIGLSSQNPEFAWNNGIAGLLGPYGIPGIVLSLTVGAGLPSSGPIYVPSLRTEITTAVEQVHYVLTGLSPVPTPARKPRVTTLRPVAGERGTAGSGRARAVSPKETHSVSRVAQQGPKRGVAAGARAQRPSA